MDNKNKGASENDMVMVVLTITHNDGSKERCIGNISRPATPAYTQGWERIFGSKTDTSVN